MKFYDLNVYSSLSKGEDEPKVLLDMAIELGFAGIGFADFDFTSPKAIKKLRKDYQNKCEIITRATLIPASVTELKNLVKDFRNQVDIIAVKSANDDKTIYVNAILDKRVDMISLEDIKDFEILDYSHFKMARENKTLIEIVTRNLVINSGINRSKLMRQMIKGCYQLIRSKAPFILASGAHSKWELRAPRELQALADLVQIPPDAAINALSVYPEMLLAKIQNMRDPNYIMPGVRVVPLEKEAEDHVLEDSLEKEAEDNGD